MVPAPRRLLTPVLLACLAAAPAAAQSFDADPPVSEAPVGAAPALLSVAQTPTVSALPAPNAAMAAAAALPARLSALAAAANGIARKGSGDALSSWTASRAAFDGASGASADDPPSVAARDTQPSAKLPATILTSQAHAEPPAPPYRRAAAAGSLAAAFNGAGLFFAAHALASHAAVPVLVLAAGGGAHLLAFAAASAAAYFAFRGDGAGLRKTLLIAAGALGFGAAGLSVCTMLTHGSYLLSSAYGLTASNLFADAQALKRLPDDGFGDAAAPALALETFAAPTALLAAQFAHPILGLAVALSYRSLSNDYLKTHVPMPRLPPIPPSSGNPPPQPPAPPAPPPVPSPPPPSRR